MRYLVLAGAVLILGCSPDPGPAGPAGARGADGVPGKVGPKGPKGDPGVAPAPDVAIEHCDTELERDGGLQSWWRAEHLYPGRTAFDLARVTAFGHYDPEWKAAFFPNLPAEYEYATLLVAVADGKASVDCASIAPDAGSPQPYLDVTFVLP